MLVVEHEQFIEFIKLAKRLPLFGYNDPRDTAAETKANKPKKKQQQTFLAHGQGNLFFAFPLSLFRMMGRTANTWENL